MARLPEIPASQLPPQMQSVYGKVTGPGSGLAATFSALFNSPDAAQTVASLDQWVQDRSGLEDWIRLTVALTVAHERGSQPLWEAFEPQARQAGVNEAVIDGISAGTAPRRLLPKDGIWVQFALEILRGEVRDSTWAAVTHLAGDTGATALALTTTYYEMMARLNAAFGLDSA